MTTKKFKKRYASNDLIFKFLFGLKENKVFAIYLVETILNVPHGTIQDIKIINSVKSIPSNIKNKTLEMDVYIKVPSLNLNIIIEMQDYLNINSLKKSYFYLINNISKETKRGEKDYNKHPNFMLIIFVNTFSKELKGYNDSYLQTGIKKHMNIFEDLSNIKIIALAKYDVKCYNDVIEKPIYTFLRVKNEESLNKLLELTKDNEIIKEMNEKMKKFQSEEYVQEYWLEEWLRKANAHDNEERSFNKGFNEGKYEIAKNFIENTNTSIEDISKCTGLSLSEVKKLKNKVKKLVR